TRSSSDRSSPAVVSGGETTVAESSDPDDPSDPDGSAVPVPDPAGRSSVMSSSSRPNRTYAPTATPTMMTRLPVPITAGGSDPKNPNTPPSGVVRSGVAGPSR